jgi:hypothetical protein
MRPAIAFTALLALSPAASAQFARVQPPAQVLVSVPFMVDVTLDCPPPGEGPPPSRCDGLVARVETSNPHAVVPAGQLFLPANFTVRLGPFIFHQPGCESLTVLTDDDIGWVGEAGFVVRAPVGPVRRR